MSTTFVVALIVCVFLIAYWRVALIILLALVLALLLTGVSAMAGVRGGSHGQPTTGAPTVPGPAPNGSGNSSDNSRGVPPQPHN